MRLLHTILTAAIGAGCVPHDASPGGTLLNNSPPSAGDHYALASTGLATGRLENGASSAEDLARRVVRAFVDADTSRLRRLLVSEREFVEVVYPALGQHYVAARDPRPETRAFLWEMLTLSSDKGMRAALKEVGRSPLAYVDVTFPAAGRRFATYVIFEDPVVSVRTIDGDIAELHALGSVIEHEGIFKLMAYRELE